MNKKKNTATAFSEYVLRKTANVNRYMNPDESSQNMEIGIKTEIHENQYKAIASNFGLNHHWELIHNGLSDNKEANIYEARFLTVDGCPLRCKPDLVYRSEFRDVGEAILIVEKKTRTGGERYPSVPDGSWPNVRAQLWCYSWISDWDYLVDSNVILITEHQWCAKLGDDPVYMGCRGAWRRNDLDFNRMNFKYFEDNGGKVDSKLIYQLEESRG
jgi:hypothetical protein